MDGAAPGPPPGLSKPPLARRPPGPHRSLKQREREAPDVDWARALQHFGGCVRADLDDLHRRFTEQRVVTFAAWKMLWRDARMSAAFHVEFWESTPTATHKTILQQALDGLVWCIEERGGEFGSETDVTALIGRVFALYCAHSVQLGTPKHKIDVDPQDWTALLTVNCVMCGAGATMFPSAAREVRAMMYRLVVLEKAFLRCLQGFGPSVRAQDRAGSRRGGGTGARQDAPSVVTNAIEDDTPVQHSKMEQLKSLNDRYQEVLSRARSSGTAGSSSGTRLRGRRGLPTPQLSGSLRETENEGQGLIGSLTSYLEYKRNEEARRQDRVVRAAAAREVETRKMLEASGTERDDSSHILDLSDRGSVMSVPPSPTIRSVASSRYESRHRHDSDGSEAFFAELESELHADILSDQAAPLSTLTPRYATSGRHSSAISQISEADSDALADLERELEHSVDEIPSQPREQAVPAKSSPPARRKRGRNTTSKGIVSKTASRTAQVQTQKSTGVTRVEHARTASKHGQRDSTASRSFFADSWAASSTAESDGLAEIQAELDAIPMENLSTTSSRPIGSRNDAAIAQIAKPKTQQTTRQPTGRTNIEDKVTPAAATHRDQQPEQVHAANQRRETRSRALSIVSDSSELIAQLQAELDYSSAPPSNAELNSKAAQASISVHGIRPRRSSRVSSVASDTGSNSLEELERELKATPAAPPQPPLVRQTKTASRKRGVVSSQRAAQQYQTAARSNVKRIRTATPSSQATSGTWTSAKTRGKQRAKSSSTVPRVPTRTSAVSSDTESDVLAELMLELDTPVVTGSLQRKEKMPAKKASVPSSAPRKSPSGGSESFLAELESELHDNIPSNQVVLSNTASSVMATTRTPISVNGVRPRRSSRLSSVASDTGTNALEELERELNASTATLAAGLQPPATKMTKTTTRERGVASSKRPAQQNLAAARGNAKRARTSTLESSNASRMQRDPIVTLQSTRTSTVSSDTESDGLAELMSELNTPVATEATSTQQKKIPSKRATAQPTARKRSSPKTAAPRSALVRSKAPPRAAAAPAVVSLRRSARLSSVASDAESDGLEDLMAELDSAPSKQAAVNSEKPSSRAGAAQKQPTRALRVKAKGKQVKKDPKVKTSAPVATAISRKTRTHRAPRQTQTKPSRTASKKVPPTSEPQTSSLVPPSSRRSTRSGSVALDSDSDGLAELEAELQAGNN